VKDDQASTTALLVQQAVLYSATRWSTAHLVPAASRDASIRLLSRLPEGQRYLRQLERARWRVRLRERLLVPGIMIHHALRKRWIEDRVRAAIDEGARQVVNLGAGLDTLLLRLASERDDLRLIEVDHPATQRAKAAALDGEEVASRLELLPVDFTRQTLAQRLPEAVSFDPSLDTVLVLEGVLPYLDETEAHTLFGSLRELLGAGTRIVFTFVGERSPTGRPPQGPLLTVFLALAGEAGRLRLEPDAVKRLVESEGLSIVEQTHTEALLERYGAPSYRGALHDLEMHAVARVGPRASAPRQDPVGSSTSSGTGG